MAYSITNLDAKLKSYMDASHDILVSNAIFNADSTKYMNIQTEVKAAVPIVRFDNAITFANGKTCGFSADGDTTFTNRLLTPAYIKIQKEWCDTDLLDTWVGQGASPETLRETARLLWGDPSAEELRALLEDVRGRYFPGTAGSSLSAAACAAELADFFLESGVSPDEVDRVAQDCLGALSAEDAELFAQQLDGVVSAFSSLTGENGAGLLEDCGYAAEHFPWKDENVKNCFVALLGSD